MAALGPNNEFDLARRRAQQQENANLQAQKDAIARRQAQAGGGVSGAFQKQERIAADDSAKRLQDVNEGIDTAQRAEERRMREIEEGRQFARSEREAGQTFQAGESLKGREFQAGETALQRRLVQEESRLGREHSTSERLASQAFGTSEREAAQKYSTGEREAGQTFQSGLVDKQQTFQAGQQAKEIAARYDLQAREIAAAAEQGRLSREQADKQLEVLKKQQEIENKENVKTNYVNAILSAYNSKMSPDAMKKLLDGLGVDFGADGSVNIAAPTVPGVNTQIPSGYNTPWFQQLAANMRQGG